MHSKHTHHDKDSVVPMYISVAHRVHSKTLIVCYCVYSGYSSDDISRCLSLLYRRADRPVLTGDMSYWILNTVLDIENDVSHKFNVGILTILVKTNVSHSNRFTARWYIRCNTSKVKCITQ